MTDRFPDVSLSTERLLLRPYDQDDIPELVQMMNDELVTAWTGAPHPYTEATAHSFVTHGALLHRNTGQGAVFAVTEQLTQRLVGTVQLQNTDWRIRGTEIGYLTASWARGEGYASESVLAVVRWLFAEQGFQRVELRTAADNSASQQVAQKIGCISEGVLRNAGIIRVRAGDEPQGNWLESRTDLLVWGLLPEDLDDGESLDGLEGVEVIEGTSGASDRTDKSGTSGTSEESSGGPAGGGYDTGYPAYSARADRTWRHAAGQRR